MKWVNSRSQYFDKAAIKYPLFAVSQRLKQVIAY